MASGKSQIVDSGPIHSFENPPLIESVLGFQFKRLPKLANPWLSIFWESIRAQWPNVEEAPPIESQYEKFGDQRSWATLGSINLRLIQEPATRLRITNSDRSRMIQVQNGRFHYNWLKVGTQSYPRYSGVRSEFDGLLLKFKEFLSKNSVGSVEPDQWEVTYIDHFPKGTVWNSPRDWSKLFPAVPIAADIGDELSLDSLLARISYEIKPQLGRLHLQINHGLSQAAKDSSKNEILRMDLTARGSIQQDVDLSKGLDIGRRAIIGAFFNATSPEAHKYWGYKHAS